MTYTPKYLSVDDWASFRGVTPTSSTTPSLEQVQSYIEMAESEMQSVGDYTERSNYDVIYKGLAHGVTLKEANPSINSLYVSNGDLINPTWSLVDDTNYVLKEYNRVLIRSVIVNREYKLNINSGYSILNVPMSIKYLVYLMSMRKTFNAHLFENNVSDSTTRIVDVEVYREITNGGDPFKGFGSLNVMINEEKANLKGKLRTRLG